MTKVSQGRTAVRRLRRGVVSTTHIVPLSVGLEKQVEEIRKQLRFVRSGAAQAVFVEGEWGTGKSHLLSLMAQMAADEGMGVAYLNLNGQNAAINHPQRFYHLISARVNTNRSSPGISEFIGTCSTELTLRTKLLEWAMINDRTSELGWAIRQLLENSNVENTSALSIATGADLSWADYGYKREKAIRRIADLGHCLWYCGFSGLVLELDELETIDQLWNSRSRKGAYEVLGRLVQMKHVLPVFAVTAKFRALIDQDFVALSGFGTAAVEFLNGWRRRQYPLLNCPVLTPDLALVLARRVDNLYAEAYSEDAASKRELTDLVSDWSRMPTRSPRTLLRRIVHHLDIARNGI